MPNNRNKSPRNTYKPRKVSRNPIISKSNYNQKVEKNSSVLNGFGKMLFGGIGLGLGSGIVQQGLNKPSHPIQSIETQENEQSQLCKEEHLLFQRCIYGNEDTSKCKYLYDRLNDCKLQSI